MCVDIQLHVTHDKTGLIAYLKVSRNAGFKYLVCCSLPMVKAMCTKFSHVLHQFLTSRASTVQVPTTKFPAILVVFKPRLTSGDANWVGQGGQDGVQKCNHVQGLKCNIHQSSTEGKDWSINVELDSLFTCAYEKYKTVFSDWVTNSLSPVSIPKQPIA